MRLAAGFAAVAFLAASVASPATAQTPQIPPQLGKPPLPAPAQPNAKQQKGEGIPAPKPTGATIPAAPARGQIELLCRGLTFSNIYTGTDASVITTGLRYDKVSMRDADGVARSIYALTSASVMINFLAPGGAAGARGQNLRDKECGPADSVLTGLSAADLPRLTFVNPPGFHFTTGTRNADTYNKVDIFFPACPSGVRRFTARRDTAGEFAVSEPTTTSCVD